MTTSRCRRFGRTATPLAGFAVALALAPGTGHTQADDWRAGHGFIATHVYSAAEDRGVLQAFEGLRVADISDGMDFVGLAHVGRMDPEIHPLWKDTETFAHRFTGIAVTVRYVPAQYPVPDGDLSYDEYRAWEGRWYNELSPEPFMQLLRPGSALVIDEAPDAYVG